jgi:hypothetical protein
MYTASGRRASSVARHRQVDFEIAHLFDCGANRLLSNDKITLLHHTLSNLMSPKDWGRLELAGLPGISIVCGGFTRGPANQYWLDEAKRLPRSNDPLTSRRSTSILARIRPGCGWRGGTFEYAVRTSSARSAISAVGRNATLLSMALMRTARSIVGCALRENCWPWPGAQQRANPLLGLCLAEIAILRQRCHWRLIIWNAPNRSSRESAGRDHLDVWTAGARAVAAGPRSIGREAGARRGDAAATPVNFNVLEGYAGIAEVYLNL